MKQHEVRVRYTFDGSFFINADSKKQANEHAIKDCSLDIGDIFTSLPDKVVDWNFPVHPERKLIR